MSTLLTRPEAASRLQGLSRHQFCELECSTEVKMRKTGNPLRGRDVRSLKRVNVRVNGNYEKQVRRETGDDSFTSGPIWNGKGERINGSMMIRHIEKGTVYLQYFPNQIHHQRYVVDGMPATDEQIETIREFKTKPSGGITQMVNLDNVVRITINKQTFVLVD